MFGWRHPMMRLILFLPLFFFFLNPLEAQLGRLKNVLDKAQKLSDLQITEEDEIALGQGISEKIRARYGVAQDLEATRYVTLVGKVVAAKSSRPNLPYQFVILDSDGVNAFAAPGGFIHITRGALASFKDEAELAGVLGHEIAHITEKHTVKGLQKLKGIELAEGQTSLRSDPGVLAKVVDSATEAILQGFGRTEEMESDRVGVRLSARCSYDPDGLVRFLDVLKARNSGHSSRAGLFASHPETQERIDKLNAQIESEKLSAGSVRLPERLTAFVKYEVRIPTVEEEAVEGARGVAGSVKKDDEKKKSRFSLAKLKNPVGKGEKSDSAEVTGAGAGRGVGEEEAESDPAKKKNPALVQVQITQEELQKFIAEGKLK
jgi:beta-barrel assembly-enhancing protease